MTHTCAHARARARTLSRERARVRDRQTEKEKDMPAPSRLASKYVRDAFAVRRRLHRDESAARQLVLCCERRHRQRCPPDQTQCVGVRVRREREKGGRGGERDTERESESESESERERERVSVTHLTRPLIVSRSPTEQSR